jgi:hypothetical protein
VLAPRAWSEADGGESWWMTAQCLLETTARTRLEGRLRFLQLQHRGVEARVEGPTETFRPVESLEGDGELLLRWDEGVLHEIGFGEVLATLAAQDEHVVPFAVPGGREVDLVRRASGEVQGRVVRERWPAQGRVCLRVEPVEAERPLLRLTVRVENVTPWAQTDARREEALRAACLSSHLMLSVSEGAFVSLLDPPAWARDAVRDCRNERVFPVLAGADGERDLVLAAPIILYDHPQIAPESPGDFFDATEIDELLALRTATLTDEEKRHARATDPRAAAVIDRVAEMPAEMLGRLHGAIRELQRAEMTPREAEAPSAGVFAAVPYLPGSRVRLCPGRRRTDAQDLLLAGCTATVEKVLHDVEDQVCLAVTLDDDPAAELHRWYGRYHYFYPDEVEPLAPADEGSR